MNIDEYQKEYMRNKRKFIEKVMVEPYNSPIIKEPVIVEGAKWNMNFKEQGEERIKGRKKNKRKDDR